MKKINTEYGDAKKIMEVFGVTGYPTVRDALRFKTNSDLAKRIRTYAIRSLGRKVIEY